MAQESFNKVDGELGTLKGFFDYKDYLSYAKILFDCTDEEHLLRFNDLKKSLELGQIWDPVQEMRKQASLICKELLDKHGLHPLGA